MLQRDKFHRQLQRAGLSPAALAATYGEFVELAIPAPIPPTVLADPDDDVVIATALGGAAALIVSGDADLLRLAEFRGIPIVDVSAFVLRWLPSGNRD